MIVQQNITERILVSLADSLWTEKSVKVLQNCIIMNVRKNRKNIGDTFCTIYALSKICRVMHYALVIMKVLKFRKMIVKNSSTSGFPR